MHCKSNQSLATYMVLAYAKRPNPSNLGNFPHPC